MYLFLLLVFAILSFCFPLFLVLVIIVQFFTLLFLLISI
jgi:hypothetical protein